jgi:hypothetical protein
MPTKTITHQQVVDLVMTLPTDRLVSVYDFARFVQSHPLEPTPAADIFGETEDEIRADEERWDQQFATSREELQAMAREAATEFRAGRTKPMEFTPEGRLAR